MSVCLSASISPEPHARSLPQLSACYLRPWLGPLPRGRCNPRRGWREYTARAKCDIYDCLVFVAVKRWNTRDVWTRSSAQKATASCISCTCRQSALKTRSRFSAQTTLFQVFVTQRSTFWIRVVSFCSKIVIICYTCTSISIDSAVFAQMTAKCPYTL